MKDSEKMVLACIDGSPFSDAVTDFAAWVSGQTGAPLTLLHNIEHRAAPPLSDLSGNIGLGSREELMRELTEMEERRSRILMEQGKALLAEGRRRTGGTAAVQVRELQRHGSLVETLIEMEEEIRVLVIGVRGEEHRHSGKGLGAHLESAIRALHRPVLVVNSQLRSPPREVMVAYDGSEAAQKALEMVASSPLYRGGNIHLITVEGGDGRSAELDKAAARLAAAGLSVTPVQLEGRVGQSLENYQDEHGIEMIVMGAFGHSRWRELLLGSVTHRMLVNSRIPLLLLR